MASCKDCLHYERCQDWCENFGVQLIGAGCSFFKNQADVVEVKHGKWIKSIHKEAPIIKDGRLFEKAHEVFCCSVCDVKIVGLRDMSFCPFCGARMDGERREVLE